MAEKTTVQSGLERASELSDDVIELVEAGRRAAVEAVRKFVNAIEEAIASAQIRRGEKTSSTPR